MLLSTTAAGPTSRLVRLVTGFLALNSIIFALYRIAFLRSFDPAGLTSNTPYVLVRGLRLDVALLAMQLVVVAIVTLGSRYLRTSRVIAWLWLFSFLNAFGAFSNWLFFRERNQHLWEMLLANLGVPSEAWTALRPFVVLNPGMAVTLFSITATFCWAAFRHASHGAATRLDLWRTRPLLTWLAVVTVAVLTTLDVTHGGKTRDRIRIELAQSTHYQAFDDYLVNQSIINPLHDLVRYYVPAMLATPRYRLDPADALRTTETLLHLTPTDPQYPLLRTIAGDPASTIENVIILQIEGLGASIFESQVDGEPVMPYLQQLAREGLSFHRVYQSFGATDGSTFATATSLPRTTAASGGHARFFPHEVNGHFGCLPGLLGPEHYHHYFFAGFRQRIDEFIGFMGNQGYDARGYDALAALLGDASAAVANGLGLFDGPMLQTVASVLIGTTGPFTAHIATATSHSPWELPPGYTSHLTPPPLATFRYADDSIRAFVERLRAELPHFDRTLFVIMGDHTSATFGHGFAERIHVPLILSNPQLTATRSRWADRTELLASHVDIVPTVLGLLPGSHPFGGIGRNLLGVEPPQGGILSNTHESGLYLTSDFVLEYTPHQRRFQLFAFADEEILTRDISAEHPEVARRLTHDYLATYETVDHLIHEKRILPVNRRDN